MIKLKTLLQSNKTYLFILIFIILFIFINTNLITYNSNLTTESSLIGIVKEININNNKVSFILKSKEKIICNYYLNNNKKFKYKDLLGKKIEVNGTFKDLKNNTILNSFNYKKYLYNKKIYKTFTVNSIKILQKENLFYKFKNKIINRINKYDDKTKIYLNLFILGDNNYLDDENYNNYKTNGIWHLFAISGMHIGTVIFVFDKILNRLKFKNLIISFILFYFMFLTNFSASVLRVTLFFYIKSVLQWFNIYLENKKILFLIALIIIIINPFIVYDIGFLYSFIISYGIMCMSNYISGNYLIKIFKISLISFIVGLPITINLNYEINILSVFLNVLYVPFISFLVFPSSIITFIFPFFQIVFEFLIYILEFSNNLFNIFKINIVIPKLSVLTIFSYYLLLIIYYKKPRKKLLILSSLVIIFNSLFCKFDNNYYLNIADVNQGDCSFIFNKSKNKIFMIDTGGIINSNYHISNNIIIYLKSIGFNKIDTLIITHGDYDHMGEAINLVNNFKVEKVIFNCGEYNELEQDLIQVLDKKKIPYYSCIKELNIYDTKLYFLNNKDYGNENDNSSVIYTELNNQKFLFMGDAGVEVEEDLIEKYSLKDIDVLKVGHHGSKTSSSKNFINTIEPKYSIISVGKNNRYGHPNDSVLDNLEYSQIYRTDQDGSIMFKIKNNKLKIETCSP